MKNVLNILKKLWLQLALLPRKAAVGVIRLYQATLSYDHGPMRHLYPHGFCRFTPTCSEYGAQVIARYGIVRGTPRALWRIARCNPCSQGGVDVVK